MVRCVVLELDSRFGAEFAGKYVFKEITWAKQSRIIQKLTKYSNVTGDVVSTDYVAIQAETIMASLQSQPENHPVSLERILSENPEKGLPYGLGDILCQFAASVCILTREETAFLSVQSDANGLTQLSQTSGSQKSSGGPLTKSPSNRREQSTSTLSSSTK